MSTRSSLRRITRNARFLTLLPHHTPRFILGVLWLSITLCTLGHAEPQHHFVLQIDNPACESPLRELPAQRSEDIGILHPELLSFYTVVPTPDPADISARLSQTHAHWRAAEFDEALRHSKAATSHLSAQPYGTITPDLGALIQLRITIHLLLGDQDAADQESQALLSRQSAATLCQDTDYPEACEHLQQLEKTLDISWENPAPDLAELSEFSKQSDRTLSLIHAQEATVRWTLVHDGERTQEHEATGDCQRADFWHRTLDDWNALLEDSTATALMSPPPQVRRLERSMRIGVPVALGVLTGLSIASTVHLHQRDRYFDRCGRSSTVCPEVSDIQHAYDRWRRARGLSIAAWSTTGAVALAPIPLALFKRRALRRAQSDASTH